MIRRSFLISAVAVLSLQAWAREVVWEAPPGYSQQGLPFADGVQGVLIWGGSNVLKVTVGRVGARETDLPGLRGVLFPNRGKERRE